MNIQAHIKDGVVTITRVRPARKEEVRRLLGPFADDDVVDRVETVQITFTDAAPLLSVTQVYQRAEKEEAEGT